MCNPHLIMKKNAKPTTCSQGPKFLIGSRCVWTNQFIVFKNGYGGCVMLDPFALMCGCEKGKIF